MSLIILSPGGRREGKKDRCGVVISLRQQEQRGVKLQPRSRASLLLLVLFFFFKFTIFTSLIRAFNTEFDEDLGLLLRVRVPIEAKTARLVDHIDRLQRG